MALHIYLDTSVYNRPFDDQKQPRIWLETLAFSVILQMIEQGQARLVTSTVVEYETRRNPHPLRRIWVEKVARLAEARRLVNEAIRQRARSLEQAGVKAIDALHLACAETAQADYFVTCDDRLVNRYRQIAAAEPALTICNPTEWVRLAGD